MRGDDDRLCSNVRGFVAEPFLTSLSTGAEGGIHRSRPTAWPTAWRVDGVERASNLGLFAGEELKALEATRRAKKITREVDAVLMMPRDYLMSKRASLCDLTFEGLLISGSFSFLR